MKVLLSDRALARLVIFFLAAGGAFLADDLDRHRWVMAGIVALPLLGLLWSAWRATRRFSGEPR